MISVLLLEERFERVVALGQSSLFCLAIRVDVGQAVANYKNFFVATLLRHSLAKSQFSVLVFALLKKEFNIITKMNVKFR